METHNITVIHFHYKEHINNNFLRHEYEPQRSKNFMHLNIPTDITLSCAFSTQLTSQHYIHRNMHRARNSSTVTASRNNKKIVVCSILFFTKKKYVRTFFKFFGGPHSNNPRFYVFHHVFSVPSITYTVNIIFRKQPSLLKLTSPWIT